MKRILTEILSYLLIAAIIYLIACFINTTFNPLEWGTFTKVVYSLGALATYIGFKD